MLALAIGILEAEIDSKLKHGMVQYPPSSTEYRPGGCGCVAVQRVKEPKGQVSAKSQELERAESQRRVTVCCKAWTLLHGLSPLSIIEPRRRRDTTVPMIDSKCPGDH